LDFFDFIDFEEVFFAALFLVELFETLGLEPLFAAGAPGFWGFAGSARLPALPLFSADCAAATETPPRAKAADTAATLRILKGIVFSHARILSYAEKTASYSIRFLKPS
jgi:hypothetical protein